MRKRTIILFTSSILAALLALSVITILHSMDVFSPGNNGVNTTIPESEPQFLQSDIVTDYIDTFVSMTYGSNISGPPSGMGEETGSTSLIEQSFVSSSWSTLLLQPSFGSKPTGWTDDGIYYNTGSQRFSSDGSLTGYLYCTPVDTLGCDTVRFTLSIACEWGEASVYVEFWDGSNWDVIGYFVQASYGEQSFSSSASEYKHDSFRVRVTYADFDSSLDFEADNWLIEKQTTKTYYRFQAIYKFTGIDFNRYTTAQFFVDFAEEDSTEDLAFRIGAITPTIVIANQISSDFNVTISQHLTGPELYVDIRDIFRVGDEDSSTWSIERLFIILSGSNPTCDAPPVTSGLVNTNYLLAEYNYIAVIVNVSDPSGYSSIDQVVLSVYDETHVEQIFSLIYTQDTGSFIEGNNSPSVILDNSSHVVLSLDDSISLLFNFTATFACPSSSNVTYRVHVLDSDDEFNPLSFYLAGFNIESRLSILNISLNDSYGTPTRGNTDQSVLASGSVSYIGMPLFHPYSDSITISVECGNISGSPWISSHYSELNGSFTASVFSDEDVGRDRYTFLVTSSGVNCLDTDYSAFYISDEIVCVGLSSPGTIVDSSSIGFIDVRMLYSYDREPVMNGSYNLEFAPLFYQTGDTWRASYSPDSLMKITFDSISIEASNIYGVTRINMNGSDITLYWEQLVCHITAPISSTFEIGQNATGIEVWAEYYFWVDHGYRRYLGTLNLNDTIYLYNTPGRHGYTVQSAEGDDLWNVFTIQSSNSIFITWVDSNITPTTTSTTLPNDFLLALIVGLSGLGVGLVALAITYHAKKDAVKKPPEKKEDLSAALDYLDMISSERENSSEDNT